jgi:uncharacterized protein
MSTNELSRAASPYLLQHAGNPVHWQMWTETTLQQAQRLNKPILLSVGYAACHWCHVMAHESFEDDETAAVMNELFVNIKVDREERPDIDHIYMSALHSLGERGGWPLTMFLTPKGEPFWGGTYFPKVPRYGQPAFTDVLKTVAHVFHSEPDKIAHNTRLIRENLARYATRDGEALSLAALDALAPQIANLVDPKDGGLNGAPKFPNTPIFEFLWRAGERLAKATHRDLVELTFTRMSQGGIYDHVGGGFARYSVDDRWLVPHFEKMLYDNAQILELLALCAAETGAQLYRWRAAEIVAWLRREMTIAEGAFCASLDADSEGEEGKFYVWTWRELSEILGEEDARFFGAFYDASAAGNWTDEHHGRTVIILNQLAAKKASAEDEARLATLKGKLLEARSHRVRPGLDDKIMADWNGLMIAALVNAATSLEEPSWVDLAARAYRFIAETLVYEDSSGRRLAHSWRGGIMVRPGLALDYAAMMRAALALHEARNMTELVQPQRDYLADAIAWAQALETHHRVPESGLLAMAARDASDVILRLAPTGDDAIPNAHSVYLSALVRLAGLTGDEKWLVRADALFAALTPSVRANYLAHVGILNALDFRLRAAEVVTVGAKRQQLYGAALRLPFTTRILADLDRPEAVPAGHPAEAQVRTAGDAAAFVCRGGTCSLPLHDPRELARAAGQGRTSSASA